MNDNMAMYALMIQDAENSATAAILGTQIPGADPLVAHVGRALALARVAVEDEPSYVTAVVDIAVTALLGDKASLSLARTMIRECFRAAGAE